MLAIEAICRSFHHRALIGQANTARRDNNPVHFVTGPVFLRGTVCPQLPPPLNSVPIAERRRGRMFWLCCRIECFGVFQKLAALGGACLRRDLPWQFYAIRG